jgi:hypothetical protein
MEHLTFAHFLRQNLSLLGKSKAFQERKQPTLPYALLTPRQRQHARDEY